MLPYHKYQFERGGAEHGNQPLHWPGTVDGYPVRGPKPPDLKQGEVEDIPLTADFKSHMFELWEPTDKQFFDAVNDKITIGWYRLLKREDRWDDDKKHFRVWMEWLQIYGALNAK